MAINLGTLGRFLLGSSPRTRFSNPNAHFETIGDQFNDRFVDGRLACTRWNHCDDGMAWRKGADLRGKAATTARNTRIAAVELRAALQNAESSQRGYLVGGNEIYLAPYDSAKAQAASQLMNLKSSRSTSSQTVRLMERLSQLVSEMIDDMDRTIALKRGTRDTEALTTFGSNRGKALMDEANVFLSSIIRTTDERLTSGLMQQRQNATWLRWASMVGGLVITLVVSGAILTIYRYTREVLSNSRSGSITQRELGAACKGSHCRSCACPRQGRSSTR